MEATKSISELKRYLDEFRKNMSDLVVGSLEIPKFSIPAWPKAAGTIEIDLWWRSALCPESGKESGRLNLRKRFLRRVNFKIHGDGPRDGGVRVTPVGVFDTFDYSPTYHSYYDEPRNRACCFILFSQFLDPLCDEITKKLKERYRKYRAETGEYKKVCEAVQRSFEPLITFVVADALSQETENGPH